MYRVKPGFRGKTLALDIKGTDLYACDKAHVTHACCVPSAATSRRRE
jgi:hypothetical protein